jgi:uncharacterized protein
MPLLIDGHNLIGQMPGLSLADADDEAQLVMLLRRYTSAKRGRQAVVVFDRGVYGHPQQLNGYGVTCFFARSPQDADAQIARRLRALARPRDWTLVTSDRQLARAAEERGVRVISSQEFAGWLLEPEGQRRAPEDGKPDRHLSDAEVAEWLRIFGEPPDEEAPPPQAAPPAAPQNQHTTPADRAQQRKERRKR